AGPVGLTLALLLADRGVTVGILEARATPQQEGSKALCMQRETLELWDSVGIGEWVAERGTAWSVGRTYFQNTELFSITLPGSTGEHFPPFVNISQSEVEYALAVRAAAHEKITIHYGQTVVSVEQDDTSVTLSGMPSTARQGAAERSPTGGDINDESADAQAARGLADGGRWVTGRYGVAADGARSRVRNLLGVDFPGHSHADRFLIADIRAELPFPAERRFWFDPPFNPGRSVLIHPQPDGIWRIDWQVPADFDLDVEQRSGRLEQRIRQIIGAVDYEPVWLTVYRFHQRCAETWQRGRVFLAGDAAHLMSPFGARGLNSGVADAANLAWKLEHVLTGKAAEPLLASYAEERIAAAKENLAVTDETMRFMAPPPDFRAQRDAILRASTTDRTARAAVNSGRLATPAVHSGGLFAAHRPGDPKLVGAILVDVPTGNGLRLRRRLSDAGGRWLALTTAERSPDLPAGIAGFADDGPAVRATYAPDGRTRTWLIRPDGYVAACTGPNSAEIRTAFLAGLGVSDRPAGTGLQR
ncbi:MAG: FAD-dependent monooxygenase, partial [Actinomycetota bacterium]|nr:FAD-dependent monooxygenase [Actinomycetota bacterium]